MHNKTDLMTKIITAAEFRKAKKLEKLLDKNEVEINNVYGATERTILHYAATNTKDPQVVLKVIERKAKIDATDDNGGTALHLASYHGIAQTVRILLDNKADILKSDYNGLTALHYAVDRSHYDIAELLLSRGADPDTVMISDDYLRYYKATPLHIAAHKGNKEMIMLLLAYKANRKITDRDEETAADIFDENYYMEGVSFQDLINESNAKCQVNNPAADIIEAPLDMPPVLHKLHSSPEYRITKRKKVFDHSQQVDKKARSSQDEEESFSATGGEEDGWADSSWSRSSDSPSLNIDRSGSESSSRSYSAEQLWDEQQPMGFGRSSSQPRHSNNYEDKGQFTQDNTDSLAAENLLMILFAWIKYLPAPWQKQVFSLFSMQQMLKILEAETNSDQLIYAQLNNQPVEERFIAEHQKYYGQDNFTSGSQEYAQVNQDDSLVSFDDAEVVSSNGILIDPLQKHDINFGLPHLFDGIAS